MKYFHSRILANHNGAGIVEVLVAAIILSLLMVGLGRLLITGEEGEEGLRQKQQAGLRIQQEFDEVTHLIKKGTFETSGASAWGNGCKSTDCVALGKCSNCREKGIAAAIDFDYNNDSSADGKVYIQVEKNPRLTIPTAGGVTTTPQFGYMLRCYIKDSKGLLVSGMVTFVAMPN